MEGKLISEVWGRCREVNILALAGLGQLPYRLATTDEGHSQDQRSMPLSRPHPAVIAAPLSHKVGEGKRKLSLPLAHFVGEGSGAARG